jgi:hypothetical protein
LFVNRNAKTQLGKILASALGSRDSGIGQRQEEGFMANGTKSLSLND